MAHLPALAKQPWAWLRCCSGPCCWPYPGLTPKPIFFTFKNFLPTRWAKQDWGVLIFPSQHPRTEAGSMQESGQGLSDIGRGLLDLLNDHRPTLLSFQMTPGLAWALTGTHQNISPIHPSWVFSPARTQLPSWQPWIPQDWAFFLAEGPLYPSTQLNHH